MLSRTVGFRNVYYLSDYRLGWKWQGRRTRGGQVHILDCGNLAIGF